MRSGLAILGAGIVLSVVCVRAADVDYPTAVAEARKRNDLAEVNRLCAAWSVAAPGDERPHLVLGRTLLRAGQIDRAVEQFELAADANPLSPAPRCEMGLLFLGEAKHDEALREFEESLSVDPGHLPALLGKARAVLAKGKVEPALAIAHEASQMDPESTDARVLVADCLVEAGRCDEALVELEAALGTTPDDADILFGLAKAAELGGRDDEAQPFWGRFLEAEPDSRRSLLVRHGLAPLRTKTFSRWRGTRPRWSPDGRGLLIRWSTLRMVDPESGRATAFAGTDSGGMLRCQELSPDGRRIVCMQGKDYDVVMFTIQPDGTAAAGWPWRPLRALSARFSPDGSRLLLSGVREDKGESHGLMVMDLSTGELAGVRQGFPRYKGRNYADWTPDGTGIIYSGYSWRNKDDRPIFAMELASDQPATQLTHNDGYNYWAHVRPDRSCVSYSRRRGGKETVCVSALDGRPPAIELGPGGGAHWSPDGRRLAYGTEDHLVVVRLGGLRSEPVALGATRQDSQLVVTASSRCDHAVDLRLAYDLFDENSFRVGTGGFEQVTLKPDGEVIEATIDLTAGEAANARVMKVTAVTADGRRTIRLMDIGDR